MPFDLKGKDTMMNIISAKIKKYAFFLGIFDEKTKKQFKKYLITGLLSFSLEYLLFFVLYEMLRLWYITANAIVYFVVFWFNFLMNRYWSFRAKGSISRQLALYCILFVFNLAAITVIMYILSDLAMIPPLISKVLVMGMVVSWNFIIYRRIIYK